MDVGIVELGTIAGRLVGTDPTGRYVTSADEDTVTTYDAVTLTVVATHPVTSPRVVATHPDGVTIAHGAGSTIEVWRHGQRVAVRDAEPEWLAFTTDGAYLLTGLAEAPARVELLAPATLELLDSAGAIPGGYPDYEDPITDWGEGVDIAFTDPRTIAVAANVGDDPRVLAVIEVVDGRLRIATHATGHAFAAQLPGERISGIALDHDTLYVVDSDDIITAFAWRDTEAPPRRIRTNNEYFGPVYVVDGQLAVAVEGAIILLDPTSGRETRRLNLPEPWSRGFFEDGLVWYAGVDGTHAARWLAE